MIMAATKATTPRTPLKIQNCVVEKERPACSSLLVSVSCAFLACFSCSFRVLMICLRRASGLLAAVRPRTRVSRAPPPIAWARLAALAWAGLPPAKTMPSPAMTTKPRTPAPMVMIRLWSMPLLGRVQRLRQFAFQAVIAGAVPEPGAGDAGRTVAADHTAMLVLAGDLVDEQVLGDDHV